METVTTQVPALDKIIRIFDYLSDKNGATFSQIYQALGLAKSSTSSLLNGMTAHGLLRQHNDKYYLGLRLCELGNKSIEQFDIKNIARPILISLRDRTNLTCHLGILQDESPVYLTKLESPQAIIIRSWEGKRLSLHSSGLGKALMAWLSNDEIDALLPEENLQRFTDKTIVSKTELKRELEVTRKRGWAFDDEEDTVGLRCIAAPVLNSQKEAVAAISISGVAFQMPEDKLDDMASLVKSAAQELACHMG